MRFGRQPEPRRLDAGLDGEQEGAGLGQVARLRVDGGELRVDEPAEVERLVRHEPLDLGECQARLLERTTWLRRSSSPGP